MYWQCYDRKGVCVKCFVTDNQRQGETDFVGDTVAPGPKFRDEDSHREASGSRQNTNDTTASRGPAEILVGILQSNPKRGKSAKCATKNGGCGQEIHDDQRVLVKSRTQHYWHQQCFVKAGHRYGGHLSQNSAVYQKEVQQPEYEDFSNELAKFSDDDLDGAQWTIGDTRNGTTCAECQEVIQDDTCIRDNQGSYHLHCRPPQKTQT
ncbi:hypothetical protein HGRIS_001243 [Hohenbuehelia grisea]|uniref:PARP-type domain-containing protein n=1 Tax=Hohenbuehelia grisea TaxID=104357 RepID=A0ABR3JQX6_9AGAR